MASLLGRDYVALKIDTDRHQNGKTVAQRLRGDREGGIPWMVITDAEGTELITSDGPQGNCGCPVAPHEVEWFVTMIQKTARTLTEEQIATIEAQLNAYAESLRR